MRIIEKENNIMNPLQLLSQNKKCIINADLDGLLCGIFLNNFFECEIVGFSMCSGSAFDQIWVKDGVDYSKCVFVDLPVFDREITAIDQHFCAISSDGVNDLLSDSKKFNPNILLGKYYLSKNNGYTSKYPFGTVHFISAYLENAGIDIDLNLLKGNSIFEPIDVLLRADRVIGNSCRYNPNCRNWASWLNTLSSGNVTQAIVNAVNNAQSRLAAESSVENALRTMGCARGDGDCSNMLRANNYTSLQVVINWLSGLFSLRAFSVPASLNSLNNLRGYRMPLSWMNAQIIENMLKSNDRLFSYAIVSGREISITEYRR